MRIVRCATLAVATLALCGAKTLEIDATDPAADARLTANER